MKYLDPKADLTFKLMPARRMSVSEKTLMRSSREEGKAEEKLEIARNLKAMSMSSEAICKATELSLKDISVHISKY